MGRSRLARGRDIAIFLVKCYQRLLSPFLGANCRFYPTCSQYSVEAFERHGFIRGFILTAIRILKCGPWHPGGIDHVPENVRFGKLFRRGE